MKRGRAIAWVVLLAVIATIAAFMALRPREPVYEGKRLSEWLEEFSRVGRGQINQEAENAIRQIGTNALPFLVADLCREDSQRKLALMEWYNKWSSRKIPFKTFADRRGTALTAFYVLGNAGKLGPAAKPFLPSLGKPDRRPEPHQLAGQDMGSGSLGKTQFGSSAARIEFWLYAQFV